MKKTKGIGLTRKEMEKMFKTKPSKATSFVAWIAVFYSWVVSVTLVAASVKLAVEAWKWML